MGQDHEILKNNELSKYDISWCDITFQDFNISSNDILCYDISWQTFQ